MILAQNQPSQTLLEQHQRSQIVSTATLLYPYIQHVQMCAGGSSKISDAIDNDDKDEDSNDDDLEVSVFAGKETSTK